MPHTRSMTKANQLKLLELPQEILCNIFSQYYRSFDLILVPGRDKRRPKFLDSPFNLLHTCRMIDRIARPICHTEINPHLDASRLKFDVVCPLSKLWLSQPAWLRARIQTVSLVFDLTSLGPEACCVSWMRLPDGFWGLKSYQIVYRGLFDELVEDEHDAKGCDSRHLRDMFRDRGKFDAFNGYMLRTRSGNTVTIWSFEVLSARILELAGIAENLWRVLAPMAPKVRIELAYEAVWTEKRRSVVVRTRIVVDKTRGREIAREVDYAGKRISWSVVKGEPHEMTFS